MKKQRKEWTKRPKLDPKKVAQAVKRAKKADRALPASVADLGGGKNG